MKNKNNAILNIINKFKPDILAVGLGMPIQEQWILENFEKIDSKVFLNGGAFLEWLEGKESPGIRALKKNNI